MCLIADFLITAANGRVSSSIVEAMVHAIRDRRGVISLDRLSFLTKISFLIGSLGLLGLSKSKARNCTCRAMYKALK